MVFSALLQRLAAQDKVAICRCVLREEAAPRFVALVPQLERLDAKHVQVAPPGFHLIYLPFNDDLRKLRRTTGTPADEPTIKLARKVVERLELKDFTVRDYENPGTAPRARVRALGGKAARSSNASAAHSAHVSEDSGRAILRVSRNLFGFWTTSSPLKPFSASMRICRQWR